MTKIALVSTMGLLWLGVNACGAGRDAVSTARVSTDSRLADGTAVEGTVTTSGAYYLGDHDDDDFKHSAPDNDDPQVRDYGEAADSKDMDTISKLVARYYAAAALHDGARACSLLSARLSHSADLVETVPDAYVAPPDASALYGKGCSDVATRVFGENGAELAAEIPTLLVTAVRLEGRHGLVLLGFKTTPERFIEVVREGGHWTIDALLDTEMP